jgi:hypothetical protein
MAILNVDAPYVTLDPGAPTTLLSGATATGAVQAFTLQPRPDGALQSIVFQEIITGSPTTVSINFETSLDGGTTWSALTTGILTQATLLATASSLAPGSLYRLNLVTLSGGTSPTVTVNASAS